MPHSRGKRAGGGGKWWWPSTRGLGRGGGPTRFPPPMAVNRPQPNTKPVSLYGMFVRRATMSLLYAFALFVAGCHGLTFHLAPAGRECVHMALSIKNLRPGVPVPLTSPPAGRLSVIVRPRLDGYPPNAASLRVKVTGPSKTLLELPATPYSLTEDLLFLGEDLGEYDACFFDASTLLSVEVTLFAFDFAIDALETNNVAPAAVAKAEDAAVAAHTVERLRSDMRRLRFDQEHLVRRQKRHAETLRSSDQRSAMWAALECATLAGLAGLQILLFRKAFANY